MTIDVTRQYAVRLRIIKSFKCRKTERIFEGQHVAAFSGFRRQAEKRLRILDAADTLEALAALPSNRFEHLSGDRAGQCSIRVNQQWRVYFTWDEGANDVEIVDYH
ncbi:proteic killer suppression protein [Nitrosospira briensis]|uniref:Proteic killer suppression protein n=1 Tax=Nitrosospira briensis TaxID=35799 RepID=A0A1I4XF69_9PROT|nr:type II toxin-antitoxin system RelE/ParE family toxin [Nitrosospira briensis]SFN24534.1 proteic killer suppression protein [Nitrosospira briensis]